MSVRILHLIDHLGHGGAQVSVKNIAENIDDKKFETFICALRTNPVPVQIKSRVISLKYGKYDPRSILTIIKLCKEYKIDILHAHLQKSIIGCLLVSYFRRIPVIIHERGAIFRKGIIFRIYRLLLRVLHHRAAVIIANSQATACELIRRTGIRKDEIEVIYNAVDFAGFDPDKILRNKAREKLGILQTDIVIGFVGRLHPIKGVDLLIEAFALLLQQSRSYILLLAGDGPERKSLEALARRLGVGERVKFLGMCNNVPEVMAAFDVGTVPSRQEPFGRVAVELMRMKVPIVCSGVDGLAELVTDGVTGLITKENTPEEIADAVQCLANDKKLQRQLIDNAYNFSEQFNVGEHVKKIEKIYSGVLSDTNRPKR